MQSVIITISQAENIGTVNLNWTAHPPHQAYVQTKFLLISGNVTQAAKKTCPTALNAQETEQDSSEHLQRAI